MVADANKAKTSKVCQGEVLGDDEVAYIAIESNATEAATAMKNEDRSWSPLMMITANLHKE